MKPNLKIQLIRNATMKIYYAGKTFLTDPMLSPKGTIMSFAGKEKNPTVELPFSMSKVLENTDAVIVSHIHPDHFDSAAIEVLNKDIPLFCQIQDKDKIKEAGFTAVKEIETSVTWNGITITKTGGYHGSGEILKMMGDVSGFVLQADNQPTIYWIGDVIWGEEVEKTISTFNPDIIITHSGGALIPGHEKTPILMNAEETIKVAKAAPNAKIIAIHMESLDHLTVTREMMKKEVVSSGIDGSRIIIPADGEIVIL